MHEYEDHFNLDSEFEGSDIHTDGPNKALESANERPCRSTREKNPVSPYGYDEYITYHYVFIMKIAPVRELEMLSKSVKVSRLVRERDKETKREKTRNENEIRL